MFQGKNAVKKTITFSLKSFFRLFQIPIMFINALLDRNALQL